MKKHFASEVDHHLSLTIRLITTLVMGIILSRVKNKDNKIVITLKEVVNNADDTI